MKKFKNALYVLLAIVVISATIRPTTVAYAANAMAFSVGTDYGGWFGVDTTSDATNAADLYTIAGYESYYSTKPTVSILKGNFKNGIKRMRSDVLFFSGHGNYDHVGFNYDGKGEEYATGVYYTTDFRTTDGYELVGLSGNMDSVKLVTFAACLTASNNDNNITAKAVGYGADTAVGWSSSINAGSHSNWLARYNDKLATGSTVLEAVTYANSFTYLDSDVKDARIYGDRSLVIKLTSGATALDEDFSLEKIDVKSPVVANVTDGLTEESIVSAARNNLPDFDPNDYEINIYNICDNCYTVDLVFSLGNIRTSSCYTMTIIDGKITEIVDNTFDIDRDELKSVIERVNIDSGDKVMRVARDVTNSSSLKSAKEQELIYYYNAENKTLQKVVFTVYQFDCSGAVGKDVYIENFE